MARGKGGEEDGEGEGKAEGRRQKVSHCGGGVPRHKASGEPEGQKDEFIYLSTLSLPAFLLFYQRPTLGFT